jgi:hypothetical protein
MLKGDETKTTFTGCWNHLKAVVVGFPGARDETLCFKGTYPINWKEIINGLRYFVVEVNSKS